MQILNQIASIELGFQLRSQVIQSPESKELLIQMKDVSKTNGVNWKTCVPTQLPGKKMPQWLCDGDVIVVARGFNFFAAHIQDIPQGFQAVAAPAFFVLSKINAQILPEYLTWWLNQVPTQRYFEKSAEGAISKSLKRNALENTPVIIPPLEQALCIFQRGWTQSNRLCHKSSNPYINFSSKIIRRTASLSIGTWSSDEYDRTWAGCKPASSDTAFLPAKAK